MSAKKLIPFACILTLLLAYSADLVSLPIFPLMLTLFFSTSLVWAIKEHFDKLRVLAIGLFMLTLSCFLLMNIKAQTALDTGLERQTITKIEGALVYDSSLSSKGNTVVTVKLDNCSNIYGNCSSAKGLATVVLNSETDLCAGCKVSITGKFSEDLFIGSEVRVTDKKTINYIRQRLILSVRQRLLKNGRSPSSLLSLQLLLGTSEEESNYIAELASKSGCLHVLALSGMHLNFLASFCSRLFKNRKLSACVKYFVCTLFVFIAGPRPSLIRALIMVYLSFLPSDERLACTFLIQSLLFPSHMVNLGCLYAYSSVLALLTIRPYVKTAISVNINHIPSLLFSASLTVPLLNAPIQLLHDGVWYPSAIVTSPAAGVLALLSMALGFIKLIFPSLLLADRLNNLVFKLMEGLFSTCMKIPTLGVVAYLVYLIIICSLIFIPHYIFQKRRNNISI